MSKDQNIFSTVRMYKKTQNTKKDLDVMSDLSYPDFLVPIAYNNLLYTKTNIPVHYLDVKGIRAYYIIRLLINSDNRTIYNTDKYIQYIYKYTLEKEANLQFPGNLADYTQKYLSNEHLLYFIFWWENTLDFETNFLKYTRKYKIKEIDKVFIGRLYKKLDVTKHYNILISSDFEFDSLHKHPLYEVKRIVEFLETNDVNQKRKMLENPFLYVFRDILECNLRLFDVKEAPKYITHNEMMKYTGDNNFDVNELKDCSLIAYIKKHLARYVSMECDNLFIRSIVQFFDNPVPNKPWHFYFVPRDKIESYDQCFVNRELFKIVNYNCIFTKEELIFVDEYIKTVTKQRIVHLYFLSECNPKYKNALSEEVEEYLDNELRFEDLLDNADFNFICLSNTQKCVFGTQDRLKNIEEISNLELDARKMDVFLYLVLIRIGANNFAHLFDFYFSTNHLLFLSVLFVYISSYQLEYAAYKNVIDNLYDSIYANKKYANLTFEQKLLMTKFFDLFMYDSEKPCQLFLDNLQVTNLRLLDFYTMPYISDHFDSSILAIDYLLGIQNAHFYNDKRFKKQNLYHNLILENTLATVNDMFISGFSVLLATFVNHYAEKHANVKAIRKVVVVPQQEIENIDNFFIELLYKNKDINAIVNTYCNYKDIQLKMYLPRAWRIYFTRNKVDNLQMLLSVRRSPINQIHILCICAALYTNENKEMLYTYVKSIKNINQELLFYKFVFLFYALQSKDEEARLIFIDCQHYAATSANRFVAAFIGRSYGLSVTYETECNMQDSSTQPSGIEVDAIETQYPELTKIFGTDENTSDRKSIYEAIRIMDCTSTISYKDKEGIQQKIFARLMTCPRLTLKTLTKIKKLENQNWKDLEYFIERGELIPEVIDLILEHRLNCSFTNLIPFLKEYDIFYKHKCLVDMLDKSEILDKTKSRTFCNVDLFDKLERFEMYSGCLHSSNETYYKTNHFEILSIYAKTCKVNYTLLNQIDLVYCQLKFLEYNYFDKINWEILTNCDYRLPFDFQTLRNEVVIERLVVAHIKKECGNIEALIEKIAGEDKYFYPCFLNQFKSIQTLRALNMYKEFEHILE